MHCCIGKNTYFLIASNAITLIQGMVSLSFIPRSMLLQEKDKKANNGGPPTLTYCFFLVVAYL